MFTKCFRHIEHELIALTYNDMIHACLNERDTDIVVACCDEDHKHIYGFVVGNKNIIHFAYIRYSVRRAGICNDLINEYHVTRFDNPPVKIEISHLPLFWGAYQSKSKYIYNPFTFIRNDHVLVNID